VRGAETLYGKRMLVEISHTIERFALAAEPGSPLVVIAMFQKLSYFAREVDVYREIAARDAVTVVGLAEDFPPELPPGVRHALLGATDPLAREWSVTVLGPKGGATLVAVDQESLDPHARTIEEGRRFRGSWSFSGRTRTARSCGCVRSCGWAATPPTGSTRCCAPCWTSRSRCARTPAPSTMAHGLNLLAGVIFVVLLFAGTAAVGAVAFGVYFGHSAAADPAVARALTDLGYGLVFIFAVRGAGMFALTTTTLLRTAKVLPTIPAVIAYLLAAFLLLAVTNNPVAFLVFPAWVVLVSVFLLRHAAASRSLPHRTPDIHKNP
jgi:hypothetical protein